MSNQNNAKEESKQKLYERLDKTNMRKTPVDKMIDGPNRPAE